MATLAMRDAYGKIIRREVTGSGTQADPFVILEREDGAGNNAFAFRDAYGHVVWLKADGAGTFADPQALSRNDEGGDAADLISADASNALALGTDDKLFVAPGATGDITAVTAGVGLTGGGASGDVSLASATLEKVGTALQVVESGGNARGVNAVDLQKARSGGTQVASGQNATIGGGGHNTASGQNATIGGGGYNTASGIAATIGGGGVNTASGQNATIGGGSGNAASGQYAAVGGGIGASAYVWGQEAYSGGYFAATGDAQRSSLVARRQTSDATPTELFLDNSSARVIIPSNKTWQFLISIVARADNGDSAAYVRQGCIKNVSGTTALVGTVDTIGADKADAGAATWAVAVSADDTNDALKIEVTGAAASNIRWVTKIELVEVAY